jgi:hypothetical protein
MLRNKGSGPGVVRRAVEYRRRYGVAAFALRVVSPALWFPGMLRGDAEPVQAEKTPHAVRFRKPTVAAMKAEYVEKGLDAEPDTFVIYRIIGNDLPPRHVPGQTLENLRFTLEHEPVLEGCEKRWILNRIVEPEEERKIIRLLRACAQEFIRIPFDWDEYRRIGFDFGGFPRSRFFASDDFLALPAEQQLSATMRLYRHKSNYVMNNNGARNAALRDGRRRAKWILPWDGNCFLTQDAWQAISTRVKRAPYLKYFLVPMARILNNDDFLLGVARPRAREEPQILFRRDAAERFNEAFPYGRRPKVELFWRLGIPGKWDEWRNEAWDLPRPRLSHEAGQTGKAGWVARLSSGVDALELQDRSRERDLTRAKAALSLLQGLDEKAAHQIRRPEKKKRLEVDRFGLKVYHAGSLDLLRAGLPAGLNAVAETTLNSADAALGRGPYSILDKTSLPPSGDPRDYWQPAPFWWPDETKPEQLPYVRRDGQRVPGTTLGRPGSEKYDRTRLQMVFDDTTTLALAWHISRDELYAEHAGRLIRHWFLAAGTGMKPHLRYAQVRTGHNNGLGNAAGIIETRGLHYFLDAVRLLSDSPALARSEICDLDAWLQVYLRWLLNSRQGRQERDAANNHGTFYDLQVASIAAYLGDSSVLTETLSRSCERIGRQFEADGSQPRELNRAQPIHYCAFNLEGWVNLAQLGRRCGFDIWGFRPEEGGSLKSGVEWFARRLGDTDWPGRRTEPFDADRLVPLLLTYCLEFGQRPDGAPRPPVSHVAERVSFSPDYGLPPYWSLCEPFGVLLEEYQ